MTYVAEDKFWIQRIQQENNVYANTILQNFRNRMRPANKKQNQLYEPFAEGNS